MKTTRTSPLAATLLVAALLTGVAAYTLYTTLHKARQQRHAYHLNGLVIRYTIDADIAINGEKVETRDPFTPDGARLIFTLFSNGYKSYDTITLDNSGGIKIGFAETCTSYYALNTSADVIVGFNSIQFTATMNLSEYEFEAECIVLFIGNVPLLKFDVGTVNGTVSVTITLHLPPWIDAYAFATVLQSLANGRIDPSLSSITLCYSNGYCARHIKPAFIVDKARIFHVARSTMTQYGIRIYHHVVMEADASLVIPVAAYDSVTLSFSYAGTEFGRLDLQKLDTWLVIDVQIHVMEERAYRT